MHASRLLLLLDASDRKGYPDVLPMLPQRQDRPRASIDAFRPALHLSY